MTVGQPSISVDSLVFRMFGEHLQILLSKRWADPYAGEYALPGVLLKTNESIKEAAIRAVEDKLDLSTTDILFVKQFKVFDNTNRDPRGDTVSVTCFIFVKDDVSNSGVLFNVEEIGELPFDHNNIIGEAIVELKNLNENFIYGLLGENFTTSEYLNLARIVDFKIDSSNASRIIPVIYQNVSKIKIEGRKTLWGFSKEFLNEHKQSW